MVKAIKNLKKPSDFDYAAFFQAIKNKVISARINFSRQANREANALYWFIGEMIVMNQEKQGWGNGVVENLSRDLKKNFPDIRFGFSERNLWDMRRFFLEYQPYENLRQLVAEIGWSSNLVIINKIKNIKAREYYLKAAIEMGWTRNILELQINSQAYEHQYLEKKEHNFAKALPAHLAEQADKTLKSVYSLEMLGIAKPVFEKELQKRMVSKIKEVLREFGRGFTFIGDEYRIVAPNGRESFIDLLCFNRVLRSIVCIELKTGPFKPEYAGKMNYYLSLIDDQLREKGENPSIGIILCTNKDHVDVEFALRDLNKPIGVSGYRLTNELPKEVADKMPDAKKLEEEILKELNYENEKQNS